MIITDLDKTLLRNDGSLSENTMAALRHCQERGIKTAFATARSTQAANRYLKQFQPEVFIGYGGALVKVGEETIHRFEIPTDIAKKILAECRDTPDISFIYAINENEGFTNDQRHVRQSGYYRYHDFTELPDCSFLKISATSENPAAAEDIAVRYPCCHMLRYSGEDLYCFANLNAGKWNAIMVMAEYYECVKQGVTEIFI